MGGAYQILNNYRIFVGIYNFGNVKEDAILRPNDEMVKHEAIDSKAFHTSKNFKVVIMWYDSLFIMKGICCLTKVFTTFEACDKLLSFSLLKYDFLYPSSPIIIIGTSCSKMITFFQGS